MTHPILDTARAWAAAGASVIPIKADGSKAPALTGWKAYIETPPTADEIDRWFSGPHAHHGIGVVCGEVSGNLEMLELEGRAVAEGLAGRFTQLLDDHGLGDLWRTISAGYLEQTPSGGLHWLYRVADGEIRGNTKLARRPSTPDELAAWKAIELAKTTDPRRIAKVNASGPNDVPQVLSETRGSGGMTVVAPSGGPTHPTGLPWRILAGGPSTVVSITAEQRDNIHAIATLLDQMPVAGPREPAPASNLWGGGPAGTYKPGSRPGDDYNARASWDDILTPHGWTRMHRIGPGYGWRRPGKSDRSISATTGQSTDGVDRLYVFSTSTEFDSEVPYSKFGALAVLEYGGDHAATAKALRSQGFGDPFPPSSEFGMRPPGWSHQRPTSEVVATASTDGNLAEVIQLPPPPTRGKLSTHTDQGNATLFLDRHAAGLRYVPSRGAWIRWTGANWGWCEDDGEAISAAVETIQSIEADGDNMIEKHRTRSLSRRALEATVAIARRDHGMRVPANQLDADPYALNTPSGVVDLRTGHVRPSQPDDLNTNITAVPYDPAAEAPRWKAFLDYTFDGDAELPGYVQRLTGYSAAGVVLHHVLPFLHGGGGNGKSVFLDVIAGVLGSYATTAPPGFLMANGREDESAIARLSGLRLVIASEVNQSARFDEAKVKLLTGGDRLTARFLFQRHFTFVPTHTLWIMGNHQPRVDAGGESFWRRLRLIPFTRTVPKEDRVEGLAAQLVEEEGIGILTWIVQGAVSALANGLAEPDSVLAATQQYADEEDSLARFLADRCYVGGGIHVKSNTRDIRSAYEQWCREEGDRAVSPQVFGRELRSRFGIEQVRSHGKRLYVGIGLRSEDEEPADGRVDRWGDR